MDLRGVYYRQNRGKRRILVIMPHCNVVEEGSLRVGKMPENDDFDFG